MFMEEFKEYFNEEFFIIDSNNLDSIKTKLYGFSFDGKNIIMQNNIDNLTSDGTYAYIKNENNQIRIM